MQKQKWENFKKWREQISVRKMKRICWKATIISILLVVAISVLLWLLIKKEDILIFIAFIMSAVPTVTNGTVYLLLDGPRKEGKLAKD